MARYIDADKIDFRLGVPLEDASGDLYIPLRDVIKAIAQTPTEDVVPKSVFDQPSQILDSYILHHGLVNKRGLIDEAKREVAKEIFEEIEVALKNSIEHELFNISKFTRELAKLKKKYTKDGKE